MTALLAPLPSGGRRDPAGERLNAGLSNIARRVAIKALMEHRRDVLLEVYAAGIAHAATMMTERRA